MTKKFVILSLIVSSYLSVNGWAQVSSEPIDARRDGQVVKPVNEPMNLISTETAQNAIVQPTAQDEKINFQKKQIQALTSKLNTLQAENLELRTQRQTSIEASVAPVVPVTPAAPAVDEQKYLDEISHLKSQIATIQVDNTKLKKEASDANTQILYLQSENSKFKQGVEVFQKELMSLQTDHNETKDQVLKAESQLSALQSENTRLKEAAATSTSLQTQTTTLQSENAKLKETTAVSLSQMTTLQAENIRVKQETANLQKQLADLQASNTKLKQDAGLVQTQINDLNAHVKRINEEKDILLKSRDAYMAEKQNLTQKLQLLDTQNQKLTTDSARLQQGLDAQSKKIATDLQDHNQMAAQFKDEMTKSALAKSALQNDRNEALKQIQSLQTERSSLLSKLAKLEAELKAPKKSLLQDENSKLKSENANLKKTNLDLQNRMKMIDDKLAEYDAQNKSLSVANQMNELARDKYLRNIEQLRMDLKIFSNHVQKFKTDFESYVGLLVLSFAERNDKANKINSAGSLKNLISADLSEIKNFESNFKVSLESLSSSLDDRQNAATEKN